MWHKYVEVLHNLVCRVLQGECHVREHLCWHVGVCKHWPTCVHSLLTFMYSHISVCLWKSLLPVCAGGVENSVILVGSGSDTEGYVMMYIANRWTFLAANPDYWTDTHAGVVCRQLGYSGGVVPSNANGYRWVYTYCSVCMHCSPCALKFLITMSMYLQGLCIVITL